MYGLEDKLPALREVFEQMKKYIDIIKDEEVLSTYLLCYPYRYDTEENKKHYSELRKIFEKNDETNDLINFTEKLSELFHSMVKEVENGQ